MANSQSRNIPPFWNYYNLVDIINYPIKSKILKFQDLKKKKKKHGHFQLLLTAYESQYRSCTS